METIFRIKIRPVYMLLLLLLTIYSCGSSREAMDPKEQQQYQELMQLVNAQEFEIVNDWASPQTGNNVSLIGNSNFIRFKGDSVQVYLPYYGERYSGGGYGTSGGIEYKGPLNNLQIEEGKNGLHMSFEGKQDSEQLKFLITLFPNGNTSTSVSTSERSSISYRGEVQNF